jgi:hypothetical protein
MWCARNALGQVRSALVLRQHVKHAMAEEYVLFFANWVLE